MAFDDQEEQTEAIDTSGDESGASPVAPQPADDSGAAPVADRQSQSTGEQPGWNPQGSGPLAGPARGVKRIIAMLMGEGGDPAAVKQAAIQADPQGQMSPGDRNIVAVAQATQQGGEAAGWKLAQGNRVTYNPKAAFAYAALTGNAQKPPDLRAAIDAANQAMPHVLDGSDVTFQPGQTGVTATVKMPGSSQVQQINLTVPQFKQFLDVGRDGQWDRLMETGIPATLQRLSRVNGPAADPASQAAQANRAQPAQAPQAPKTNFGKTPSTLNLSGSDNVQPPAEDNSGIDPEIQKRANTLYPSISQQDQRNHYMGAEHSREAEMENKINVEEQRGKFKVDAADTTGQHRENAAKTFSEGRVKAALANLQAHIHQQEMAGVRNQRTLQEKALATIVMTGGKMSPQQKAMWDQITTATPEPQAAPQQQQAAPKQQSQQTSDKDQQALAWAKANPADPRAAQIKQRLGVQ